MNTVTKYTYWGVMTIYLFLLTTSCQNFVEIPTPPDQLLKSNLFTTDVSANSTIAGIYSEMMESSVFNGTFPISGGLCADELGRGGVDQTYDQFQQNNIQIDNSVNLTVWTDCYKFIYYANSILEGLANADQISTETRERLIGEAKLIRAICNFYLVNLWGDTPLVTTTDYRINSVTPRTDTEIIYRQIIADLQDAKERLPTAYIGQDRARPNKYAAMAMLARVYLYTMDYEHAEEEAESIIESHVYSLDNINEVFLKESTETIWQLIPVKNNYTPIAFRLIPSNELTIPDYPLTEKLVDSFEQGDLRKQYWTDYNTIEGIDYYYPYKYKVTLGGMLTEYFIVFRLSEQYLIRAEARARQDNLTAALKDLNTVRARAGITTVSGVSDQAEVIGRIAQERFVELFTEWSDRWLSLKRTNQADDVLSLIKKNNWQPTDIFWPIPQTQINANPYLSQNEGY